MSYVPSRRRRPVPAAGPIARRPAVRPPATAGALSAIEGSGRIVASWLDGSLAVDRDDLSWVLGQLRSAYRVVSSLRVVAG